MPHRELLTYKTPNELAKRLDIPPSEVNNQFMSSKMQPMMLSGEKRGDIIHTKSKVFRGAPKVR